MTEIPQPRPPSEPVITAEEVEDLTEYLFGSDENALPEEYRRYFPTQGD